MNDEITGTVRGNTITLDGPVPSPLEGQRVRVILEPLALEQTLRSEEQERLLREWAEKGPQGPLDAESSWPDEAR